MLQLVPGEGLLGHVSLGQSLFDAVNHFNSSGVDFQVVYSAQSYLDAPVFVQLPLWGVRLMFNHAGRRLALIEVVSFDHLSTSYNGLLVSDVIESESGPEVRRPSLKQIYNKIFGPTYPGHWDAKLASYVLSYPGISFKFKVKNPHVVAKVSTVNGDEAILSKLLNCDRPADIEAVSLAIFEGNSYDEFHRLLISEQPSEKNPVDVSVDVDTGRVTISLADKKHTLVVGETTQRTVLNILGPPDDSFNKFDSRFLIHNHLKSLDSADDSSTIFKFHNYFLLGIDFLYDLSRRGSTGVLRKIILHNGAIAESLDFMRWNRCAFKVTKNDVTLDSNTVFSKIPDAFFGGQVRPVLLNRNETELIDDLEMIHRDDFKSIDSGNLSHSLRAWGQSKLYGTDRVILEVLESNGCISSVTIY